LHIKSESEKDIQSRRDGKRGTWRQTGIERGTQRHIQMKREKVIQTHREEERKKCIVTPREEERNGHGGIESER
jgi:hypothetical protein